MPENDSQPTSKDGRSSPTAWSAEKAWAEAMKPSRQRNLTPWQRQRVARLLRALRNQPSDVTWVGRYSDDILANRSE
ncbi:hypothetical protein D3C83_198270 [compost metagenome]